MAQHIEMIIDYAVVGDDYQYHDNHGVLIRCKDCKHKEAENGFCEGRGWPMQLVPDDGFCDKGERREE